MEEFTVPQIDNVARAHLVVTNRLSATGFDHDGDQAGRRRAAYRCRTGQPQVGGFHAEGDHRRINEPTDDDADGPSCIEAPEPFLALRS